MLIKILLRVSHRFNNLWYVIKSCFVITWVNKKDIVLLVKCFLRSKHNSNFATDEKVSISLKFNTIR